MYIIKGTYKGKTETLDQYDTLAEAIKHRYDYSIAYGINWSITIHQKVS